MNLVLDIGNTNVKWAIFDNNKMIEYHLIKDFSIDRFKSIISKYSEIKNVCVSNNSEEIDYIKKVCTNLNIKHISVNHLLNFPIHIEYDTPKTLGVDRIMLAVGSMIKYTGDKLIIDLGTCITYDLVISNKYIGGQISPGLEMRLASLHSYTNKLPKINFQETDNFIGKTTNESMLIGVCDSLLFEVKNVIEKYKSRYPNIKTIITGGDLKIIKNKIKNINFINPYLLMEGLNYIIACNEEI